MEKTVVSRLQAWYADNSDSEASWERIFVNNLDNPGWVFAVELHGTELDGVRIPETRENYDSEDSWIVYGTYAPGSAHRTGRVGWEFRANCGQMALERTIEIFVDWAEMSGSRS